MNDRTRSSISLFVLLLLSALLLAACRPAPQPEMQGLQGTVAALSARQAEMAEAIVTQAYLIEYLATRAAPQPEMQALQGTVAVLSTRRAEMAGAIATQAYLIEYLATRPALLITPLGPDTTPTPYLPVIGTVQIEDGRCCVGGTAGEPLTINLALSAQSTVPGAEVAQMRLAVGGRFLTVEEMEGVSWEPYSVQKQVTIDVPLNWSGSYASVQFRDDQGNLSPVVHDDISVEGNP